MHPLSLHLFSQEVEVVEVEEAPQLYPVYLHLVPGLQEEVELEELEEEVV